MVHSKGFLWAQWYFLLTYSEVINLHSCVWSAACKNLIYGLILRFKCITCSVRLVCPYFSCGNSVVFCRRIKNIHLIFCLGIFWSRNMMFNVTSVTSSIRSNGTHLTSRVRCWSIYYEQVLATYFKIRNVNSFLLVNVTFTSFGQTNDSCVIPSRVYTWVDWDHLLYKERREC